MTSFLTGGMGSLNSNPTSRESRALEATRTAGKSFVNKDFTKNIAFLNQVADTHGAWLKKLQSGVDQANENVLEQIQGFWGDLFALFAGLEPTGIDIGDVKYIIQGLGAFLGINPDTPFPLNLFEAALHLLTTYIIPLPQFTDVIFDAIIAWAGEFGLSEDFIDSLESLMEAIEMLGESFNSLFGAIGELLDAFGFISWTSTSGIGELWDALIGLIDGLALEPLKPVLAFLADLGVPFINALVAIINGFNYGFLVPITNLIKGSPNVLVSPGFTDTDSFEAANGWTRDPFVGRTFEGSAKATANSILRELISIPIAVEQHHKMEQEVYVRWGSASYTGTNHASLCLRLYNGETLVNTVVLQSITFTGATQNTWQRLAGNYTIPNGVDTVRVSLRVNANVMTGNVWFDDASAKRQGGYLNNLFGGILDLLGLGFLDDLLTVNVVQVWTNIIQGILNPIGLLRDFFLNDFVQDLIDALISIIRGIPFVGATLANWIEDLTDWFDDTQSTAAMASDAKLGLDATREIIVTGITMAPPPDDVTDDVVEDAVSAQTSVIISQGAALEALQNQMTGENNSGRSMIDEYEYVTTDLATTGNWTRFVTSGTDPKIGTPDGHNASIDSNGEVFYRYNVETITNFQRVTAIMATTLGYAFFDARRPHRAVYCRISTDGTKWVRVSWNNAKQYQVHYRNGGSVGLLYDSGHDAMDGPNAGQGLTIEAGVGLDEGKYRIIRAGVPIRVIDDTISHLTDWTQKGVGIGLRQDDGWNPGSYTQFTASDNAPNAIRGIGFRAFKSSGTTAQVSGDSTFPSNCLNTVTHIGANMVWNQTTQELTINTEGWYLFEVSIKSSAPVRGAMRAGALYKNNGGGDILVARFGEIAGNTDVGPNSSQPNFESDSLRFGCGPGPMYAEAGSKWKPGTYSTNSFSIEGDAAGVDTYFAAALLNRSLA